MIDHHVSSPAALTLQQYFIYNERVLNIYLMLGTGSGAARSHRNQLKLLSLRLLICVLQSWSPAAARHLPTNEFVSTDWWY